MPTLRELREAANLTQLQVAFRLEVTPGTVHNWERGRAEPRARQVAELSRLYGVTADQLLAALPAPATDEPEGKAAA